MRKKRRGEERGGSRFGAGEPLRTFWRPAEALNTPHRRVPGCRDPSEGARVPGLKHSSALPRGFPPLPSPPQRERGRRRRRRRREGSLQTIPSQPVTPHQSQELSLRTDQPDWTKHMHMIIQIHLKGFWGCSTAELGCHTKNLL